MDKYYDSFIQDGLLYDDVYVLHGVTIRELTEKYSLDAKFDIYSGQGQYYVAVKEPDND